MIGRDHADFVRSDFDVGAGRSERRIAARGKGVGASLERSAKRLATDREQRGFGAIQEIRETGEGCGLGDLARDFRVAATALDSDPVVLGLG